MSNYLFCISHVMQWGQLSIEDEPIGHYFGSGEIFQQLVKTKSKLTSRPQDAVDSRDVALYTLKRRLALANSPEQTVINHMNTAYLPR